MIKKLEKMIKLIVNNILLNFLFLAVYYLIFLNIFLALFCTLLTLYVYRQHEIYKEKYYKEKYIKFQINCFVKNIGMNCLSNDFNIVDAMEKSIPFLEKEFKKDIENTLEEIKFDFNYEKSLNKLGKKYQSSVIFTNFLKNLLIIKEQSNIDTSAKKILKIASIDSRKYIINQDKIEKVRFSNLKNYLVNTAIGVVVIVMVILSLNVYYVQYAHTFIGISINLISVAVTLYITLIVIKKTYVWRNFE